CVNGWYGPQCTSACVRNCEVCARDSGACTSCVNGWYGPQCTRACVRNCEVCDRDSGACT
ncbi:hypothetical protein BaRGS_00038672, partial [Batillaria attramentaria]